MIRISRCFFFRLPRLPHLCNGGTVVHVLDVTIDEMLSIRTSYLKSMLIFFRYPASSDTRAKALEKR